jgi:hypothetical protein
MVRLGAGWSPVQILSPRSDSRCKSAELETFATAVLRAGRRAMQEQVGPRELAALVCERHTASPVSTSPERGYGAVRRIS